MVGIVSGLLTAGCSVFGIRTEQEPAYTVERSIGAVEIRHYGPRVAAETLVDGGEMDARSTGFKRLAGYIFGANGAKQSIAMTAPVAQSRSQSIPMTAPVDQARTKAGAWRIRFFMPAGETLATLPRPNDPTVELVTVPPETIAVLRYSGVASVSAVQAEQSRLIGVLGSAGVSVEGAPFTWFYDPPWTLPPLRRNEAAARLRSD